MFLRIVFLSFPYIKCLPKTYKSLQQYTSQNTVNLMNAAETQVPRLVELQGFCS